MEFAKSQQHFWKIKPRAVSCLHSVAITVFTCGFRVTMPAGSGYVYVIA